MPIRSYAYKQLAPNHSDMSTIITPIFFRTALPVRSWTDAAVSANEDTEDWIASASSDRKLVRCVQLQYATPFTVSVRQYVQPSERHESDHR